MTFVESRTSNILPLKLVAIEGPPLGAIEIAAGSPGVLGRSIECQHCLPDPAVSRRHAEVARRAGRWLVTDLGSSGGTFLNSLRLSEHSPTPLAQGDELRIYPWSFRVQIGSGEAMGPSTVSLRTTDDASGQGRYVETFSGNELQGLAQQRLSLLLDYATEMNAASSEEALAGAVLRSALAGSGLARGALVRPRGSGEQVEIIAAQDAEGQSLGAFDFSRTLIREGEAGRVARLGGQADDQALHSIVAMGIHSAICAPVVVDGAVVACLYLDARGAESRVRPDALDFAVALARLSGLAFGNLQRQRMHDRQRELEDELSAARKAQQLLVPESGSVAGVRYSVHVQPGQFVAGDLFDVVALDCGRVAVCIGDVTGHGAGAGILMAATQAHLNAALRADPDPARAVAAANRYLAHHARTGRFASLWVGVFDPKARQVTIVDAGHGHCMIIDETRRARRLVCFGGQMLGVEPDERYESQCVDMAHGQGLLLYSDGIIEQPGRTGDRYGEARLREALIDPATEDPRRIVGAVEAFAGGAALDDDATAAIVRWD